MEHKDKPYRLRQCKECNVLFKSVSRYARFCSNCMAKHSLHYPYLLRNKNQLILKISFDKLEEVNEDDEDEVDDLLGK